MNSFNWSLRKLNKEYRTLGIFPSARAFPDSLDSLDYFFWVVFSTVQYESYFAVRKVMFTGGKHKFTVQEHMFTDGKHKFTVHKHKISFSRNKKKLGFVLKEISNN